MSAYPLTTAPSPCSPGYYVPSSILPLRSICCPFSSSIDPSRLNNSSSSFLWGGGNLERKAHLVNWEVVCADKDKGGLGLRKLAFLNKALLGKWIWRFAYDKDNLWKQVIMAKYGQKGLGWRTKKDNGAFRVGVWKEILKETDWCWDNMVPIAGKGTKIRFRTNVWRTGAALSQNFPHLFAMVVRRNATVEEMWDQNFGQGGWNLRFLRDFNNWELDMVGDLLHVLRNHRPSLANPNDTAFPTSCIWMYRVPTKVAFFA